MQTFELLDRFELLYPANSKLADLRRAYIDQDLSSVFRLLPSIVNGDIEELRKAVIEQNLHSIFRLTNDEDLRKLVLEDNTWKLWPILDRYVNTQFVAAFKNFFVNETLIDNDCFSRGQLQSKMWLVSELKKCNVDLGTLFLCAGWYATLATMLFESKLEINKIRSFDIDPTCVNIAEVFNAPWFADQWRFKSITQDIMDINYAEHTWQYWSNTNNRMSYPITDNPDTIINTSCEHLPDFKGWYNKIPLGKLVIIQANDYHEVEEHVNTYNTIEEFSASAPMTTVLYEGELELPKYKRFMKIGFK
tara:strand:- start:538 stop:1452 length:915 start_codon:yes stop_codon:yes gene_type:complete